MKNINPGDSKKSGQTLTAHTFGDNSDGSEQNHSEDNTVNSVEVTTQTISNPLTDE